DAHLLAGSSPVRANPSDASRSAFVHRRRAQRIAQSRSRWTLSGSGPLRASGGGGRRREGGVPGAVDLRLHPVLLDVVRSEGLDLGGAGALDEPADRFVELRAGAD